MALQTGQHVPPFILRDTHKKEITDQTIKGQKTVLLFIPAAFTSTCTVEFCMLRDNIKHYENLNANIIGISTDTTWALAKWKEEQQINFTLASDFNKDVTADFGVAYDLFHKWMRGVAKRSAFVVDADGIIRYAEVLDNAGELPNFDAIDTVLKSL